MGAAFSTEHTRATTEVTDIPVSIEHDDPTGPVATPLDRLICVVGPDLGRTFAVGAHEVIVGRGERGIDLHASDVSRRHARLWRDRAAVLIEDLGSSNGTFVNGNAIDGPTALAIGDRIQLGSTILVLTRHDELAERLQQLQKLDAMGALVKGLAHDFNNMLTVLQAGLDAIAERWPATDPELQQTYDEMLQATESASGLIRRLLRIGRAQPQAAEVVALADVVDDALAMARHLRLERVRIDAQVARSIRVRVARDELVQAFVNLIVNARDAMPDGGELAIVATVAQLDRATALGLHLAAQGTYVDIAVRDTGTGMDEATLARIFEPFYTTKPIGKGSGLGLAMVYSTLRNHHGAVYAESTPGRGTTFRLLLPLAA